MILNLTKENFFNDLRKECPLAVEDFCKWIDEYKNEVKWNRLFNAGYSVCSRAIDGNGYDYSGDTIAPKFHELPFEFQTGVIGRYIVERMSAVPESGVENYQRAAGQENREHLTRMFKIIETDFEKKKNSLN